MISYCYQDFSDILPSKYSIALIVLNLFLVCTNFSFFQSPLLLSFQLPFFLCLGTKKTSPMAGFFFIP